jgi:hypothetical protein
LSVFKQLINSDIMDIADRKGFVKIGTSAGLVIIIAVLLLFFSSFTPTAIPTDLSGQVTGNMMEEALGDGNGGDDTNAPVLIDFTKMGDGNGDDEGDDGTGDGNDGGTGSTGGSGGFFAPMASGGSSGGGGGGSVTCDPKYWKCDYQVQQCVQVSGSAGNECSIWDDCVHNECNYVNFTCDTIYSSGPNECADFGDCPQHTECNGQEQCVTIGGEGEDECAVDDDCVVDCEPPYLAVDKTANPSEVLCEEVEITLTVSGEGEICDPHYPVDVVLVFDNSGSMDDDGYDDNISDWQPIGDAKIAAKAFIDILGSNDKAGLVSFNTDAALEHLLTFNKNNVKAAINMMNAGGWTNMSQGIDFGNQELLDNGRSQVNWIEILLSDGNNNCGMSDPLQPQCDQMVFDSVQDAVDNGIVIYTIALGNMSNQTMMHEIADMTGGKSYYAPNSSDLQEIYEEIAEEVTTIAATSVEVVDYLPDYVELNISSLPVDCAYNDTERKITCDIGDMHINETYEFDFMVYLYQLGYNLTNLYPDSGVDYIDYNLTGQFVSFPETYVNVTAYDCDHTECNYDSQTCDLVLESGDDECQTFDDCVQHTECDYQQQACVDVPGETVCNYVDLTCDFENSLGEDECSSFQDCPQHMECNYQSQECSIVEGPGSDECSDYDDCFHAECGDGYCIDVQGTGADTCIEDLECRHNECNYDQFTCEEIYDIGSDECSSFQDCPQHTECNYLAETCDTVEGIGDNECNVFEDCYYCGDGVLNPGEECETTGPYAGWGQWGHQYTCAGNNTYFECVECEYQHVNECEYYCSADFGCDGIAPMTYLQTCTAYGQDYLQDFCNEVCELEDNNCEYDFPGCTSDHECDELVPGTGDCNYMCQFKPEHTECNYLAQTCEAVPFPGDDECGTWDDCPQYTVCNYDQQSCDTVGGVGTDECSSFQDCPR